MFLTYFPLLLILNHQNCILHTENLPKPGFNFKPSLQTGLQFIYFRWQELIQGVLKGIEHLKKSQVNGGTY